MPVLAKDYDDFTYERSEKVPPRAAGVYQLADRNYQVVVIGSSAFLQEKLLEHLRDTGPLKAKVRYFWVEEAANPKAREQELLEEYKQAHGGALPEGNH
jgi:excinuclease UvrABC nuclease subunit